LPLARREVKKRRSFPLANSETGYTLLVYRSASAPAVTIVILTLRQMLLV
jgi:hypothetical protein